MAESGVFAVARSIWTDDAFAPEPFTQREAWMWLVGAAAWKQIKARGNAGGTTLQRGEFSFATRFLAEKWGWSKSRVDRFLSVLENRDMIRDTSRDTNKVYLIKKYSEFQKVSLPSGTDSGTEDGTRAGQKRDKEEDIKTLKDISISPAPEKQSAEIVELRPKASVPDPLPVWLDRDAWAAFWDMRKRIKVPHSARAEKTILNKLAQFFHAGHDPTAILDASTTNGWKSVFEPKAEKNGQRDNQRRRTSTDEHMDGFADAIRSVRTGIDRR